MSSRCILASSFLLIRHHRRNFVVSSSAEKSTAFSITCNQYFMSRNAHASRRMGTKSSANSSSGTQRSHPLPPSLPSRFIDTTRDFVRGVRNCLRLPNRDDLFFIGTCFGRILAGYGIFHVIDEYVCQLTRTEGPSMLPTIKYSGEIVLMEKFSYRRKGLKDGDKREERSRLARIRQLEWETSCSRDISKSDRKDRSTAASSASSDSKDPIWHEARPLPASHPSNSSFKSFCRQLTSPLTVGDVVVVHRPGRNGTVCKRILGLPGDIIVRPKGVEGRNLTEAVVKKKAEMVMENMQRKRGKPSSWPTSFDGNVAFTQNQIRVVPDGHIWIEGDNSLDSVDSRAYGPVPAALIIGRVVCRVWPLRGKALLGRGSRPVEKGRSFSGSINFPAGYEGERIVAETEMS